MHIRNRIKELRRVPASTLIPNPKNWRTHPESQQNALRGILGEIGFADAILVRETPAGLQILDGHCRAEIVKGQEVPVLIVDLDDAEADKLLAVLDPLAAMAETNKEALADLLDSISVKNDALNNMLEGMRLQHGLLLNEGKEYDETIADDVEMLTCPHCGKEFPK